MDPQHEGRDDDILDSELPEADAPQEDAPSPAWSRRPSESAAAFRAFACYLDLGARRSLDAVARRLREQGASGGPQEGSDPAAPRKRHPGRLGAWSRTHDWVARAALWDAHLEREARIAHAEAIRLMNARHAQEGRALQAKAIAALQQLAAGDMGLADIVRCITEGSKLERLAMGQATEHTKQDVKSEGAVMLEVVERIVVVGSDGRPTPASPALPDPTGAADAVCDGDPDEIIDDGTGYAPDFDLPDEPPAHHAPGGGR